MLEDYATCNKLSMNLMKLSERIHYFTEGYPFLVSGICQIIDEDYYADEKQSWTIKDIDRAVKNIIAEVNTLFESLVKNLENNSDLYDLAHRILVKGENIPFNALNPLINLGLTYGFFKEENGSLNFPKILSRFQQFIKEQYSIKDLNFIENNGRLLFLAFVKPIINGIGFDFKEAQISEEKRLDLVIAYNNFKYIVELKIWRGKEYHEKGIKQLCDYLDINGLDEGYLIIFNFNKNKEELIEIGGKNIVTVYV